MNWMVVFLTYVVFAQVYTLYNAYRDDDEGLGVISYIIVGLVLYGPFWGLAYMADIFQLL